MKFPRRERNFHDEFQILVHQGYAVSKRLCILLVATIEKRRAQADAIISKCLFRIPVRQQGNGNRWSFSQEKLVLVRKLELDLSANGHANETLYVILSRRCLTFSLRSLTNELLAAPGLAVQGLRSMAVETRRVEHGKRTESVWFVNFVRTEATRRIGRSRDRLLAN